MGRASWAGAPHVVRPIDATSHRRFAFPDLSAQRSAARMEYGQALPYPAMLAVARASRRNHAAGNVGVEHATPDAIRACLKGARPADAARKHFSLERLQADGLVGSWSDTKAVRRVAGGGCMGGALLALCTSVSILHCARCRQMATSLSRAARCRLRGPRGAASASASRWALTR